MEPTPGVSNASGSPLILSYLNTEVTNSSQSPGSPELEAGGDHQPVIRHGVPGLGHQLVTGWVKTGHGVLQPLGLARKHILKIEFRKLLNVNFDNLHGHAGLL